MSIGTNFGEQGLFLSRGNFIILAKLHGEGGPPLAGGTKNRGIAEQLGQGGRGLNVLNFIPGNDLFDFPFPGADISYDFTQEFVGYDNFQFHDRLQKYRFGFETPVSEGHRSRHPKSHLGRLAFGS